MSRFTTTFKGEVSMNNKAVEKTLAITDDNTIVIKTKEVSSMPTALKEGEQFYSRTVDELISNTSLKESIKNANKIYKQLEKEGFAESK